MSPGPDIVDRMPLADPAVDPAAQYDRFADIYEIWTETAPAARACLPFYRDLYLAAERPVVELGVGDGRIAVAAAARGCRLVGVDASPAMLRRCRERAERAGVADRLELIEADFRSFQLAEPAGFIALPYHSIGHLLTPDDRRRALGQVYGQLRPGGRFLFDELLVTAERRTHMRQAQLRAAYQAAGRDRLLWVTSLIDQRDQRIRIVTWEDEIDEDGRLAGRRYRQLHLSWSAPAQTRALLADAGFEVEACWGDFSGTAFDPATATEQVWAVRRPV